MLDAITLSRRQLLIQGREMLCAAFPRCFAGRREQKQPLKVGIFDDIRRSNKIPLSTGQLRAVLADYTAGGTYLSSFIPGAQRVDLAGRAAGIITAEEAAHAVRKLA